MQISVFYDHILQALEQEEKEIEALPSLLTSVKQFGIDAVEIRLEYLLAHEETLSLLSEAGLKISCIYEFYDMGNQEETEHIKCHIDTALKVGAGRVLIVPGFLSDDEAAKMQKEIKSADTVSDFFDNNKSIQNMINGLAFAAEYGAQKGVSVTVEDFDGWTSPLSGMYGIKYVLDRIPKLKYTLDMGNFIYSDEDVLIAWELLKDRVAHVHCKDRGADGEHEDCFNKGMLSVATGDGYMPIAILLDKLKAIGYDGYLAIEHFDAPNQVECMKRSAGFLKGTWR